MKLESGTYVRCKDISTNGILYGKICSVDERGTVIYWKGEARYHKYSVWDVENRINSEAWFLVPKLVGIIQVGQ